MKIAGVPVRTAALLALLAAATAEAGNLRFDVVRLNGSANHESAQSIQSLLVAAPVVAGERIRTGSNGHVVLQLPPVGSIALGADAALFVHSIEAEDHPARSGLARVVLESGAARINARAQQLPPADLRVNLGALRLRVFGAEIWAERGADGAEVCLLSGAIELQGNFGARRLDEPGRCLRSGPSGLQEQNANSAGAMAPRLALTAFPGDPTMQWVSTLAASEPPMDVQTTPQPDLEPGLTPVPNAAMEPVAVAFASEVAPAAESAADAGANAGGWTIVLASVPAEAAAEREATRLRKAGLDARVLASARADGSATYRVISGQYASKIDAVPDLRAIRARHGLRAAWVAPLQ